MNDRKPTALITGASAGIGYELAKLFAKDRHNLVLVARNGPKLSQFADELQRHFGIPAKSIAADLSWPPGPYSLFDHVQHGSIQDDILENKAGYWKLGDF